MTPNTEPLQTHAAPCGAGTPACAAPKATPVGAAHRYWPLASLPIRAALRAARRQECLRHIVSLIGIGMLSVLAFPAAAQEATRPMTLAEVVELARGVSPRVAQLKSLELAAREGERGALAGRMPYVDLSAGYTRNSDVPEFSAGAPGNEMIIFPNIPDNYRARAGAQLPLYTGGRVTSQIDAARSNLAAAGQDIVAGDRDAALEAAAAYWNLVTAIETERVVTASLSAFDQHLADAKNRVDLGFAARNELLAVQAERDQAELQRLRARNRAQTANANLLRILNLPFGTRIDPADSLESAADAPSDIERLVAEALEARAELKALRARVEAANASASTARSARLPQASLAAAYDYASPNQKILPMTDAWEDTWSVGVGVSWNVFDGGRASAAEARARAEAEALRRHLEDVELRVRLEVTERALDLETSVAAVIVSKRGLEAAQENERVSRDRYREGVLSSSELLDAETQTLRSGLDLAVAQGQLRISEAQLARALGR
ncbi:MAG: TolC family protein [Thermoanaerobaculia bacterium]|nr:TolC family protein [Thermoanaerobaculia bacterium]